MSQVSIYLPADLDERLRTRARASRCSVSAYLVELLRRDLTPDSWPEEFRELYGSCQGELEEPPDPPAGEVGDL